MIQLGNNWDNILKDEFQKEYYLNLRKFLKEEYKNYRIFPSMYDIFNALKYTDYNDVKVVIIGQDPYHEIGQAHGLCFSVQDGVAFPPSLQNIFKEKYDKIFAVELGLSSDTFLADEISELENKTFVTNSDAHSLPKIAREYNKMQVEDISFKEVKKALEK